MVALAAFALIIAGLGLAAAVIVVRADFDQTDTTQVSTMKSPVVKQVAAEYAESVKIGEITVAARVTVFRMATRYTVWGALLTSAAYMLTK